MTLGDLYQEMQRGRIWECSLRDTRWHLDGLCEGENIYIDPRYAVLESLVHELLHRLRPRMSERAVTSKARQLTSSMDEATKIRWWRAYRKIRKSGRPVQVDE
jgi:hypothetical protein